MVVSAILGYMGGRMDHYSAIREYYGVPVTAVYTPYRYDLQIGDSIYTVDICQNAPSPNWKAGETLAYLKYEQMTGCKRVYGPDLTFRKARNEVTGNPIIKEIAHAER